MKKLTQEQVNEELGQHRIWLRSDGKSGKKADFSNCDLSGLNLSDTYLENAKLENATLTNTNLTNADLENANLTNTNLTSVYLYNAYLRNANLTNADLTNADLTNADLTNTLVFSFTLGKHFGYFHRSDKYPTGTYLKIGCIGMSLEEWLEKYKGIGKKEGYDEDKIRNYGLMINLCKYLK